METKNTKRSDLYIQRMSSQYDRVINCRFELDQSFDKYLLSFSTGTLYLSLYFFKDLVGGGMCLCLLFFGWAALIISMFSALASLYYSRKSYKCLESYLDGEIKNEIKSQEGPDAKSDQTVYQNESNDYVGFWELVSLWSFIVGVLFITFFYFKSIINY